MGGSEPRDPFLHSGDQAIYLERMKLDISKLVCRLNVDSTPTAIIHIKVLQYGGAFRSRDPLTFREISANILQTVQDRHIVTMED